MVYWHHKGLFIVFTIYLPPEHSIVLMSADGPADEREADGCGPHQAGRPVHADGEDHRRLPGGRGEEQQ